MCAERLVSDLRTVNEQEEGLRARIDNIERRRDKLLLERVDIAFRYKVFVHAPLVCLWPC